MSFMERRPNFTASHLPCLSSPIMFMVKLIELAHLCGFVDPLKEALKQWLCQTPHIAKASIASKRGAAVSPGAHHSL